MKNSFFTADILLPDFNKVDGTRYAVIACDQHTSEPEYWEEADRIAGDSPSTLRLILPEVYLSETERRIPEINETMQEYCDGVLLENKDSIIYLERTLAGGGVRRGLVGCIDLEDYEYTRGAESLIRATEGTVLDRIPPRVAVRRGACLEIPHVMILIDDADKTVIEPIWKSKGSLEVAYSFPLMQGGGKVEGRFLGEEEKGALNEALSRLATKEEMKRKYGEEYSPLLFAVGDGNHSLASAKAAYEEIKAKLGKKAENHPARYALVEIVNLHDDSLKFQPIYRVMFGVNPDEVTEALSKYAAALSGEAESQRVEYVTKRGSGMIEIDKPVQQLTVGTLQDFIDGYLKTHKGAEVDYIHGIETTKSLAKRDDAIGFIFDGMEKNQLFKTVICDGALPRKTFSMGHAEDKRYYLEARRIK